MDGTGQSRVLLIPDIEQELWKRSKDAPLKNFRSYKNNQLSNFDNLPPNKTRWTKIFILKDLKINLEIKNWNLRFSNAWDWLFAHHNTVEDFNNV